MTDTPPVYTTSETPDVGLGLPGYICARSGEAMNRVEITLLFDGRTGPARALLMLARASVEVVVRARQMQGIAKPDEVPS